MCTLQIVMMRDWHLDDDEMTKYALSRSNVVINLIGANMETWNFSFDDVHAKWPAKLAAMVADSPICER